MDRVALPILLKRQDTWSFRVIWVVLHNNTGSHATNYVSHENAINSHLVVTMLRDADQTRLNKLSNPFKRLAQYRLLW